MSGWDELRTRCNEPTEMVRRDALRVGDRALSSHYGLRTVAVVAQSGRNGETTWIHWSGGTPDHVPHERYDSACLIPRVVAPDSLTSRLGY